MMTSVSDAPPQHHHLPFMDEFVLYGLAAALVAFLFVGAILGLVIVKKRRSNGKKTEGLEGVGGGLFGSTVKMPSTPHGLFPISLYKQTQKPGEHCSANDLSNMESQRNDGGLAKDSGSLNEWRYVNENNGGTASTSTIIGRGVQKWAVHFKMRYNSALQELEIALLRVSTIAGKLSLKEDTGLLFDTGARAAPAGSPGILELQLGRSLVSAGDPSSFVFFNIYLMPHESEHKQSSLRHYNATTLVFDEKFHFRLRHEDAPSTTVRLSLYTIDGGRTRLCLGHVAQPLCGLHLFDGRLHYLTRDLGALETSNMDGYLGETLLSLSYHMQKEKLKLHILDTRNLPPQTPSDSKFCFQTDIVIGDRVVKSKRTPIRSSLAASFDCSYAFQIPCRHLDVCCLAFTIVELITAAADEDSDDESTSPTPGRIIRERPWGRFTVGPCSYAHGTGVDHWKMMLANSRKVIDMWHVISRAY